MVVKCCYLVGTFCYMVLHAVTASYMVLHAVTWYGVHADRDRGVNHTKAVPRQGYVACIKHNGISSTL
jgi:hypothetical protein